MSSELPAKSRPDLSKFVWDDAFHMESQLDLDERLIRDSAHEYAQDKLQPRVNEAFEKEYTDPAIFAEMGEMGLLVSRSLRTMVGWVQAM